MLPRRKIEVRAFRRKTQKSSVTMIYIMRKAAAVNLFILQLIIIKGN